MLAVVGVAAMVAFVFLDPVMRYVSRTPAQENPVVVETRYGALTQAELNGLVQSRDLVNAFLQQLTRASVEAQIKKGQSDPRNQAQEVDQQYSMWRQMLMERTKPGQEEAAVETLVLAKRAEQSGLVVNDRSINDLLKLITGDSLGSQQIQDVVNSLHTGRKVSVARLFDSIRTEMLASKFSQLFAQSLRDIPPAQRFEYYARLNRRAKAEVMPLAVADFTGQVKNPSSEDLDSFYEAHKNRYPDPSFPEPGFKQPKRAAFQYFKADFAKFQDEFKAQVTEAEIQEYYDKNKAQFRAVELPGDKDPLKNDPSKSDPSKSDPATPDATDESKSQDPAKSEGDKPADPSAAPGAKPAEPGNAKGADDTPDQPQTRLGTPAATIRLVSTTTTADEKAPAEKDTAEKDTAEKDTAEKDTAEAESKPAEKATSEAAAEPAPPAAGGEAASGSDEKPAKKPAEAQFEPLEKVHDSIRDSIAGQKANAHVSETFDELSATMRRYADDMDRYNVGKAANPALPAPKAFPFAELAKSKGVEAKELPLLTAAETAADDLGKVRRIVADPRSRFGFRSEALDEFAFSDSLPTYKATTGEDNEGNQYLFWKTQEEAAYVPPLDKIRDKVVAAWKMIKARDFARKRANEYAAQAQAAGKPLKDVFAAQGNLKVIETAPFSWLSIGNVPFDPAGMQPRISQVTGVDHPGPDFMETVFKLSPGEVGVALNHPEDTAFVVRLVEYERPIDDLRKDFAVEPAMRYLPVAGPDQRKIYLAWLHDLNTDAAVRWLRAADTAARRRVADDAPPDDVDY